MKHVNKPPKPEEVQSKAEESINNVNILFNQNVKLQYPIGKYYADFFYPEYNLVLEVDGKKWHSQDVEFTYDRERDKFMLSKGYKIVRVTGTIAMRSPKSVVNSLKYIHKSKKNMFFWNHESDILAVQEDLLYKMGLISY